MVVPLIWARAVLAKLPFHSNKACCSPDASMPMDSKGVAVLVGFRF